MDFPLDPVGNLKTLFWIDSPKGSIILENFKNPNFPHMAQDGGQNPVAAPFVVPFVQLLEDGKRFWGILAW